MSKRGTRRAEITGRVLYGVRHSGGSSHPPEKRAMPLGAPTLIRAEDFKGRRPSVHSAPVTPPPPQPMRRPGEALERLVRVMRTGKSPDRDARMALKYLMLDPEAQQYMKRLFALKAREQKLPHLVAGDRVVAFDGSIWDVTRLVGLRGFDQVFELQSPLDVARRLNCDRKLLLRLMELVTP